MPDQVSTAPLWARLSAALLAAVVGLVLLYGVGFARWSVLYAVTGVARHAFGLPGL